MAKIKFFKTITLILVFTVVAVTYVHQQVEIFKTSLIINKNRTEVSFLLDQYRSLVYNLSRLESPDRIEKALFANEITLCMPKTDNIRRVDVIHVDETTEGTRESFLARVFDRFSTKAEAKVITSYKQ